MGMGWDGDMYVSEVGTDRYMAPPMTSVGILFNLPPLTTTTTTTYHLPLTTYYTSTNIPRPH